MTLALLTAGAPPDDAGAVWRNLSNSPRSGALLPVTLWALLKVPRGAPERSGVPMLGVSSQADSGNSSAQAKITDA